MLMSCMRNYLAFVTVVFQVTNPHQIMSSKSFDNIVIGSGTSAYFVISSLNEAGQKMAVDKDFSG